MRIDELVTRILGQKDDKSCAVSEEELAQIHSRKQLYGLLCWVTKEIERNEGLFDIAVEESLVDNIIYTLKSLRAQQQFLVQNLRRLEGVGETTAAAPKPVVEDEAVQNQTLTAREGYALG